MGPVDPLDVDGKKISDNLNNASQQPSSPYGSIANGSLSGEGILALCFTANVNVGR